MDGPFARTFSVHPLGPFDLSLQNSRFGGWPTLPHDREAIVMSFPVEGSEHSAAVLLRQLREDVLTGAVHGCPDELVDAARRQALATISLDVDGSGWPDVGLRDHVVGRLQERYHHIRPTLFHSPYEAATAFVIGHRISLAQARARRARIADELGTAVFLDEHRFPAFPTPAQLLAADAVPAVIDVTADRLRAIAQAAQEGWLRRDALRAMPEDDALAKLQTLPGVGPFFARGILHRGSGTVDGFPDDEITRLGMARAYGLEAPIDPRRVAAIAERWRPYRMWTTVLLHVWVRSEGAPGRQRRRARATPA